MDTAAVPVYQRIAPKVLHLTQLGLGLAAISMSLGVTSKTVAKAIAWIDCASRPKLLSFS